MRKVSVATPVYNGERYLAECIESVLSQSFEDFEYVIVDNCSTDRTRRIAEQYAGDGRVRIYHNDTLLPVIANYNRAARLIDPHSHYLKYVAADDLLLPDCLRRMVELAEAHPSVDVVASYKIHGRTVVSEGPDFPEEVLEGKEVCRQFFRGQRGFLGGPTNHLIRLPMTPVERRLFDEDLLAADIDYFVRVLKGGARYGFVHQVLTFSRVHDEAVSATVRVNGRGACDELTILQRHGRDFFSADEFNRVYRSHRRTYARWLVRVMLKAWDRRAWKYQAAERERLRVPMTPFDLIEAAAWEAAAGVSSPVEVLRSLRREYARVNS
jgi:glycosyltransferase involved in cell wall biosynthesis